MGYLMRKLKQLTAGLLVILVLAQIPALSPAIPHMLSVVQAAFAIDDVVDEEN